MNRLLLLLLFLGSCLTCEVNFEFHSAICSSIETAFVESKPSWTSLEIKNYGNYTPSQIRKHTFGKTPNLTILRLKGVAINIGRNSFQGLNKLQRLELLNNKIDKLSSHFFKNLREVTNIYIVGNNVKILEAGTFQNMDKLRILSFRKNNITIFPADVVSSTNIEELYLDDNGIEQISVLSFINMPKLRRISLLGNKISSFEVPLLFGSNSLNLDRIWLGKNNLEVIKSTTFELLPNLRYLFLEENKISVIEDCAFDDLINLVSLDLSNNLLWYISPKVFPKQNMEKLELLLLHNNRLTFIENEIFSNKPILKYATFYGNPLQCPCYNKVTNLLAQKNISQVCDENTYQNRPICIARKDLNEECSYNMKENKYLYEEYLQKMKSWPPWDKKCQFAEGYDNIQWVNYSS